MSMLPSVDDSTIHLYLGSRQERLREKKLIQDIERQELGLNVESKQGFAQRISQQKESSDRLALPFPRRLVERKAKHDLLDMRLANKQRQGPLPVDEEIAEENEILAKQIQKLRQTGVHLLQGGGGTVNLSASGAGFFGQGERQQQQQNNDKNNNNLLSGNSSYAGFGGDYHYGSDDQNNNNNTFLTSEAGSFGSFHGGPSNNNNNSNTKINKNVYAGDVLFRPGRMSLNLEPSDFWLYTRQKVTQRTLGTQVLQHPVVVGQSTDAASLKQLLLQSPIASIIKKKIANLLAQTTTRTRCGILFDLLSTRNIIVSGVPNIVGQIIYEHVADVIGVEHSALKFVFVGITDNSNCCAARDVFCQNKNLQGKNISSTKRGFEALDNVHTFAVAPPGGFETLLGPAALANELIKEEEEERKIAEQLQRLHGGDASGAKSVLEQKNRKRKADQMKQHNLNRSSPLGMRPWHAAMKKGKSNVAATADPLVQTLQGMIRHEHTNASTPVANFTKNEDSNTTSFFLTQEKQQQRQQYNNNSKNNDDDHIVVSDDDHNDDDEFSRKHKAQMKQLKEIEEALSPLPTVTQDDLLNAFDSRDLKYLPNLAAKKSDVVRRWEQNELKHMTEILIGPTVKLSRMTKRYNTQTPSVVTMMKRRLKVTPTTFGILKGEIEENEHESGGDVVAGAAKVNESQSHERKTFTVGHEKFRSYGGASTPIPVSSMAWK